MPIINIQLMEGRPIEKITAVVARVTDVVSEELDSPRENIRVLITEIPKTHWGIAGVTVANREMK